MSDFFKLASERESCRAYSGAPVEKEKLMKIMECARLSPSACNSQPWSFIVANGGAAAKVREAVQYMGFNKFTDNAAAFIVVCEEKASLMERVGNLFGTQHFAQMDIGLVTAHICYAAHDLGLSTCILGWFNEKDLKQGLNLADDKCIRLVVAVGYAASEELRTKKRKDLEDIITYKE